ATRTVDVSLQPRDLHSFPPRRSSDLVLMRTIKTLVILLAVGAVLTTFPSIRQIGASLLASAGLAGLIVGFAARPVLGNLIAGLRSEEHTSELQSREKLVCRRLLEKKN